MTFFPSLAPFLQVHVTKIQELDLRENGIGKPITHPGLTLKSEPSQCKAYCCR